MRSFAAIDLHSNNGVLTVIDENDRVLRQKKLANRLELFVGELEPAAKTNEPGPAESILENSEQFGSRVHEPPVGRMPRRIMWASHHVQNLEQRNRGTKISSRDRVVLPLCQCETPVEREEEG